MQTLGDLFRTTRERKGISVTEVSEATKIREALIHALENGHYHVFTSETHAKSFLRTYAKYLCLNEEKVLALYRRDRELNKLKINDNYPTRIKLKTLIPLADYIFNSKNILRLVIGTTVILIGYFFYSILLSVNAPPSIVIISPKNNEVIRQETFTIEGYTNSPQVKVIVDGVIAEYIDATGRFIVNARFNQPGLKRFNIIAENQFQKRNEYSLDLIYHPPQKTQEKKSIRIKNNSQFEQKILIAFDGKKIFDEFIIPTNESREFEYVSNIEFKNFNFEALSIYLDDDTEPIRSIDSNEFSINIDGVRVILKIK
jgi:transcriptional regulator with XRE-family HTH domain